MPEINPEAVKAKERGNEAYKKKQFEEALKHYDEAINLDPNEITFYNNKAAVFFEQKNYEDCIQQCDKAIEIGRENRADFKVIAKAYARAGSAYAKLDDLKNARHYYQKSLTEHRTPDTLTKLSEIEKQIKEIELKAYVNPEISLEEKTKGNELFAKGDYPGAIKHYTEAIKRNPTDSRIYSNRAACYQKLTEFGLALKDCEETIRLDPTFIKGYIRKGMALLAMKDTSKAQVAFQSALDIDPSSQEALEGYRKCQYSSMTNPDEARKRAMNDPEIQQILSDPAMRIILEQMQQDPKAAQEHLRNPEIMKKIEKLISAGMVGFR